MVCGWSNLVTLPVMMTSRMMLQETSHCVFDSIKTS